MEKKKINKTEETIETVEIPEIRFKLGNRVKFQGQDYIITNVNKNGTYHISMNDMEKDVNAGEIFLIGK